MEQAWFLLALSIGGCTVGELKSRMSWNEFKKWMYKFEEHPFGETAMDMRFIDLLTVYGNANRKQGKRPSELQYFGGRKKGGVSPSAEHVAASLRAWGQALNE